MLSTVLEDRDEVAEFATGEGAASPEADAEAFRYVTSKAAAGSAGGEVPRDGGIIETDSRGRPRVARGALVEDPEAEAYREHRKELRNETAQAILRGGIDAIASSSADE